MRAGSEESRVYTHDNNRRRASLRPRTHKVPQTSTPHGRGHHNPNRSLQLVPRQQLNSTAASCCYRDFFLHTTGASSFSRHNRNTFHQQPQTTNVSSPLRPSANVLRKPEDDKGRQGSPRTPTARTRQPTSSRRSPRSIPTSQGGKQGEPVR
jgi:hypothetical protein